VAAIVVLRQIGVAWMPAYVPLAAGLWLAVHASGVHPTIAGVVLGLLTPSGPLGRLEERLRPWTTFAVLPVFALANAGVRIRADAFRAPGAVAVFAGVAIGLAAGKVVGITGAARLAAATRVASRPEATSWPALGGAAMIGGIGFTVSLFITELAFTAGPVQDAAKLGVLTGSVVAGTLGAVTLRVRGRHAMRLQ
jgi:NhaA family Na+:H+ antiporter